MVVEHNFTSLNYKPKNGEDPAFYVMCIVSS